MVNLLLKYSADPNIRNNLVSNENDNWNYTYWWHFKIVYYSQTWIRIQNTTSSDFNIEMSPLLSKIQFCHVIFFWFLCSNTCTYGFWALISRSLLRPVVTMKTFIYRLTVQCVPNQVWSKVECLNLQPVYVHIIFINSKIQ